MDTLGRATEMLTATANSRMKRPVKLINRDSAPGAASICTNPVSAVHTVNRKIASPAETCNGRSNILVGSDAFRNQKFTNPNSHCKQTRTRDFLLLISNEREMSCNGGRKKNLQAE